MSEFVYTTVPGKIPSLLQKLREIGVPQKISVQWLKSLGFTSSNDSTLVGVLRQIGFVDSSLIPTPVWTQYRGNSFKQVLGNAIRSGYAELFAVYPDAHSRSNSDIEHVFSTSSSAGKQVISKTVSTFKALAESATFEDQQEQTSLSVEQASLHQPVVTGIDTKVANTHRTSVPTVHIDIQIHIASEASTEQIDQIFRSMAKHLYGVRDGG